MRVSGTSGRRRRTRWLVVVLAAALLLAAAPASAHVTAHSVDARPGATDVVVTLRVPNEKDDASTVSVQAALPQDTPLIGVFVRPLAGWTASIKTAKLAKPVTTDDGTLTEAASLITWTGGRIGPGQYQDFDFDVSALPRVKALTFKVLQTYSDGEIVRWIDVPAAGQPPSEHPAATLALSGGSSPAVAAPQAHATDRSTDGPSRTSVRVATGLAVAALLGVAALAITRRRS